MTAPALPRPPRVTTACLFVGLSCLMLLLYSTSALSNWGSIEIQDQIRKVLADNRINSAGLNVTDVMGLLRWVLMGATAVAIAGIVFAIYTAMGHQASRVIVTILCGVGSLVFLAGGIFGILPAAFSIGCGIYLWTSDSREWFAVKNGKQPAPAIAEKARVDPFATAVTPTPLTVPALAAVARPPLPKAVLGAGLTALIMSSMVALVCGLNAIAYVAARGEYVRLLTENPLMQDTVRQIGMTPADLAHSLFIGCTVAAVVALAAVVAAGATLAGKRTGRALLVILTILTLPISIVAFPVGLMWTAGAIATLVLLKRPESQAWFATSH